MPQAELFIVLLLCFRALPQVRVGVDNYHKGASYFASVEAVKRHLTAASRARERHGDTPVSRNWQLLECRNVSFSYDGGADILHDFSASIRRSEFWAILGPSGSGKTTALDLILGLLKPVSGSVRIDGSELETLDLATWHQQIAYLGQEPFAFAGTLRENLQWGADEPLTDLSLSDALRAARLGHSLDKEVGESGSELSGGEKQRLALARLFLRQPTLLILDEPTAALDRDTEKDILESISTLFQDTTMVLVTHREELTHDADHIVRFSDGSVRIESRTDRPAPAGW
jgi:ABC-type multidrug transport system fused ATPase/permease subunit